MKKILLLADIRGWAFDYIAHYIAKILEGKYQVDILYVGDFKDYGECLEKINSLEKYDLIHVFYRIYLSEFIRYISKYSPNSKILNKFINTAVTTGVPETRWIKDKDIEDHLHMFSFVDNYYTVSAKLYNIYTKLDKLPKPWTEVIYDNIIFPTKKLPNDDKLSNEKLVVTWVGNSKGGAEYWGEELDLKGLNSLILPAIEEVKKQIDIVVNIADGSVEKKCHQEISDILQNTDILLIGSKDEGTPLPAIEAMASSCVILSTDVGIVPEIVPEIQTQFILKTKEEFCNAIIKLHYDRKLLMQLKQENYQAYKKIFLDLESFKNKWTNFFEASIKRSKHPSSINKKYAVFDKLLIKNISQKINNKALAKLFKTLFSNNYTRRLFSKFYFFCLKIDYAFKLAALKISPYLRPFKRIFRKIYNKLFISEQSVFTNIYATDFWTQGSGPGSISSNTVKYRALLQKYLNDPNLETYTDLGCGDWQIMKLIDIPDNKTYIGYDIVKSVIQENQKKYQKTNINFYHTDNLDKVQPADLLIIKDVLMHWPNKRVKYFVDNILPKFKYALITEGFDKDRLNMDIAYGEWSPKDLTSAPFYVKNLNKVLEYNNSGGIKRVFLYENPNNRK